MHARMLTLALTGGVLALLPRHAPDLPAQLLPVYGGSGGTAFSRDCGAGKVMSGLRFRSGLVLDAVGLLCRPVNADGTLGAETTVGTLTGGGGGTSFTVSCTSGRVVQGANIFYGAFVDGVQLLCRDWSAATRTVSSSGGYFPMAGRSSGNQAREVCEEPTQPARAIRGRSASLVDAIGFICNEP